MRYHKKMSREQKINRLMQLLPLLEKLIDLNVLRLDIVDLKALKQGTKKLKTNE